MSTREYAHAIASGIATKPVPGRNREINQARPATAIAAWLEGVERFDPSANPLKEGLEVPPAVVLCQGPFPPDQRLHERDRTRPVRTTLAGQDPRRDPATRSSLATQTMRDRPYA